jgi:tungstate transport system substrate-binding protein
MTPVIKLISANLMRSIVFTAAALAMMLATANSGERSIIIQSTTSTQNSGLFDFLLPQFKSQTGIIAKVVAVGTGQALKNGRNGDGDVLLVHAKSAEEIFVAEGYGVERLDVMYNDFVIIGPTADPAGLAGTKDILAALKMISDTKSPFASRGDASGTNTKELQLWEKAGIDAISESGNWYRETGSGMGATLNLAVGMGAYTLSDRATWIAFANKNSMNILSQGDPLLFNQYGVILVNSDKHQHVKTELGQTFIDWLTGPVGQSAIADYKLERKQLFFPNAK